MPAPPPVHLLSLHWRGIIDVGSLANNVAPVTVLRTLGITFTPGRLYQVSPPPPPPPPPPRGESLCVAAGLLQSYLGPLTPVNSAPPPRLAETDGGRPALDV